MSRYSGTLSRGPIGSETARLTMRTHQMTGNAGLYHVARELSRFGWHVMPTVRNARGADLFAVSADESRVWPIQSKALSKLSPAGLGIDLDKLRSPWWVITVNANTPAPTCYVMTLEEVKANAHRGEREGRVSFWLQPKAYVREEYKEAWHRLGDAAQSGLSDEDDSSL